MILPCLGAQAQTHALRSLRAIHRLTPAQAREGWPVSFEATVSYYDQSAGTDLFVQDGDLAMYVFARPGLGLVAGDQYLQQAALRMKSQLRPGDLLARLGGDEFAVLVRSVPGRAPVCEIAHRLEHCFDQPFALEGVRISGSASVGVAMYPEDGTSRDSLLSAADAAMYVAKNTKKPASTFR
jgi:diguanylate cyclase (GGDEF)-like protein